MSPWPYPLWIAHRGAGTLAPENTLAAFREGARRGWRAFECDVKLSLDDVPFLLHDTTLERTTSGSGVAGEQPWAGLSRLDAGSWHSAPYAGEPLPTLEAVARFIRRNGFAVNLEIKPTPGHETHTGRIVAQEVARLWAGDPLPPLLSSFSPEALAGAREGCDALPRALLIDTLWDGWPDTASSLGCKAVVAERSLTDAALLQKLRDAGLRAMVYTVNDAAQAQQLRTLGIDGIVTDGVHFFTP